MTTRSYLQNGILHWFYADPNKLRTISSIQKLCMTLSSENANEELEENPYYQLFYPLFRWGLVEYYGDRHFRLSPTAAFCSDDQLLICHPPRWMRQELQNKSRLTRVPGIYLLDQNPNTVQLCKNNEIGISKFNLDNILKRIPSISKIINAWNPDHIIDTTGFQFLSAAHHWKPANHNPPQPNTLYKKSEQVYAARSLMVSSHTWKIVPNIETDVNASTLATIFCKIHRKQKLGVEYHTRSQKISIETDFFPVLLERLLSINTLFDKTATPDINSRTYPLKHSTFNLMNKIFQGSIPVI